MPWQRVAFPGGNKIELVHLADDEIALLWMGTVEIWKGAPGPTSHPELEHAFLRLLNLALHQDFIRHAWTWELPDNWQGWDNTGDGRRYMVLTAKGGSQNWTLVLRFPPRAPQFVYAAVAGAFNATSAHAEPAPTPKKKTPPRRKPAAKRSTKRKRATA